ncbi:MAG TPA: cupin domain-containing protein [Planctomycetaceae bacterium]|nr:cupin domain-containing protein [Planctomycetaceae bacterium]
MPDPLLAEMFSRLPYAEFLETYFLKRPYCSAGTCTSAAALGGLPHLLKLLAHPQVDVLIGRTGTAGDVPVPRDLAALEEVLSQGWTIGIRHADQIDRELAEHAHAFEETFSAATDVHFYCTPADQPGFGWHYDAEDVFILQTEGEKEWQLRKNTVNPWPLIETLPANQRYEREIMPILSCRLQAGDWLYIPAGYWHQTKAGARSISLSVGLRCLTALDLFDAVRPQLREQLLWRQRLPPGRPDARSVEQQAQWDRLVQELSDALKQRLSSDHILEDLMAAQIRSRLHDD